MFNIQNGDDNFFLFYQIEQAVITKTVTINSFKLPFKFFYVITKKWILFKLWVNNLFYFVVQFRV